MKRPQNDGPTLWDLLTQSVANAVQALAWADRSQPPRPEQHPAPTKPPSPAKPVPRSKQGAIESGAILPAARRKPRPAARPAPSVDQLAELKPTTSTAARTKPAQTRLARTKPRAAPRVTMHDRYDALTRELLAQHSIRVRKWRTSMSGVAWELRYRDGTTTRLIEAPKPKSPMSLAIFLHEVGHHVIGLGVYRPRCLEEYHAWRFALDQMAARGFPITDRVQRRYQRSMHYAVAKATRRGIKSLPDEVQAFTGPMPR